MASCNRCGKNIAVKEDYDFYREGMGDHLCWGNYEAQGCQSPLFTSKQMTDALENLRTRIANNFKGSSALTKACRKIVFDTPLTVTNYEDESL